VDIGAESGRMEKTGKRKTENTGMRGHRKRTYRTGKD
jgi:hypothetical protein